MTSMKKDLEAIVANYKVQIANLKNNHGVTSTQEPLREVNSEVEILERDLKVLESIIKHCIYCFENALSILEEKNIIGLEEECLRIGDTFKLDGSDEICQLVVMCPEKQEENVSYISIASPVGKSIIGRKVGDKVYYRKEDQKIESFVTITSIDRLEAKAKVK